MCAFPCILCFHPLIDRNCKQKELDRSTILFIMLMLFCRCCRILNETLFHNIPVMSVSGDDMIVFNFSRITPLYQPVGVIPVVHAPIAQHFGVGPQLTVNTQAQPYSPQYSPEYNTPVAQPIALEMNAS